jgi:transcriptional regulator with XRE-family HTH domain
MRYAQNATTGPRRVHTVAELQMALADKARGQRIAQLRKRRRLTQQAMAERLQIAYRTYQTWEAGTMPEWHNLEKLATALGVRAEHIIGEDEVPADVTQLDRIEAKLDALLDLLTPSADESAAAFEAELDAAVEQDERPDDDIEEDEPGQQAGGR